MNKFRIKKNRIYTVASIVIINLVIYVLIPESRIYMNLIFIPGVLLELGYWIIKVKRKVSDKQE